MAVADESMPSVAMPDLTSYVRGAKGSTTLASNLAIGGQFQVTVAFDRTLPNTNYAVLVSIEGGGNLLGALIAQPISSTKTTTTVDVLVKNTGLIALGLNATITAFAVYT